MAREVWAALGDVDNYIEPFFGSGAVLLGRPPEHAAKAETVNDADCYLANFWRALAADPGAVAEWADWPVNEADLFARHMWLVTEGRARVERTQADPDFFDAKVAGWWVWGQCSWVAGGWCAGNGPWHVVDGKAVAERGSGGVTRQLPHLGNAGQGVNRKENRDDLLGYFAALAARFRRVRVCCGDWKRVVTRGAMAYGKTVGVFMDPPYLGDVRTRDLYRVDDHEISAEVRQWCLDHGDDPRLRIVLAGYVDEHDAAMPSSWRRYRWSTGTAYQNHKKDSRNVENRHKECLWYSPHCLGKPDAAPLFEGENA